jgi:DNA-binding MarR family transcriptional regulator
LESAGNENRDWSLPVPQEIFRKDRFLILKFLAEHGEVEFTVLRDTLKMTDGNLASHLRALENLKYVEFKKGFVGRRTRTIYRLTPAGLTNFQTLVHYLNESLSNLRFKTEYLPVR